MKSTSSANSAGFTKRAAQSPFVLNSPISHVSCRRVANRCKEAGSVVKGRFTVYATPSVADVAPTETKVLFFLSFLLFSVLWYVLREISCFSFISLFWGKVIIFFMFWWYNNPWRISWYTYSTSTGLVGAVRLVVLVFPRVRVSLICWSMLSIHSRISWLFWSAGYVLRVHFLLSDLFAVCLQELKVFGGSI